jgi:hypothetical protein
MQQGFILLIACFLCSFVGSTQDFRITNGVAFVNDTAYVKIEKKNKKNYSIYNIETGEKLLIINLIKVYNSFSKSKQKLPRVFFVRLKENMEFEVDIQNKLDLISFLYDYKLISIDGDVNEKILIRHLNYIQEYRRLRAYKNSNN